MGWPYNAWTKSEVLKNYSFQLVSASERLSSFHHQSWMYLWLISGVWYANTEYSSFLFVTILLLMLTAYTLDYALWMLEFQDRFRDVGWKIIDKISEILTEESLDGVSTIYLTISQHLRICSFKWEDNNNYVRKTEKDVEGSRHGLI